MRRMLYLIALVLVAAACAEENPDTIRLLTHDSFADGAEGAFDPFTEQTGITVELVPAGDAGSTVNQAVLTRENPLGDVLFGVDDTFLSRALDNDIFQPYQPDLLETVPPTLILDPEGRVTPISFGDVCLNYDAEWFADQGLELPQSLDDLRRPEYAALVTVEHPATSSPGLAFLMATVDVYGEDGFLDFWADLAEGQVNVAPDWSTAYYGDFTRYGGTTPLVVSYASSPPAEVMFAEEPTDTAPTGVLEFGCYRQIEFAGILEGTDFPEEAGLLIDYMLSEEFQEMIPERWFVFPANSRAVLPEVFVEHTSIPADPAQLDPETIAANRERWIDDWVSVMGG